MAWKVLETHCVPKDAVKGPEDMIVRIDDKVIAVLDGHSNYQGEVEGLTRGQFAVKAGARAFEKYSASDDEYSLVKLLTTMVGEEFERVGIAGEFRPGFVFVAFLPQRGTIVRVGDCQYKIDGEGDNRGIMPDRVKSEIRVTLMKDLLAVRPQSSLIGTDPTREVISWLKLWQHTYRNSPDPTFGYGVIDGTDVPAAHIDVIPVKSDARTIILSSDGYPPQVLAASFDETEANMEALLKRDPLCIKEWVAVRGIPQIGRRPDDCSYVSLRRIAA